MLSVNTTGTDLISRGQEVIIQLSCEDWNRGAPQGRGRKLASEGFHNVLPLSGDYPTGGYPGAIFDIDSAGLLKVFYERRHGGGPCRWPQRMKPTRFFLGTVVNNDKRYERELMPRYFKFAMKVKQGATFFINRVRYDSRKHDGLLKYRHVHRINVHVLANVYVLSAATAHFCHAGRIPSCVVTDELLTVAERLDASPDRDKKFLLEFAAKQCAIAHGPCFRGMRVGGHIKFEDYDRILSIASSFREDDWNLFARGFCFHQSDEFHYVEPAPESRLSSTGVNREYVRSKTRALPGPAVMHFSTTSSAGLSTRRSWSRAHRALSWVPQCSGQLSVVLKGPQRDAGRRRAGFQSPGLLGLLITRHRICLAGIAIGQKPTQLIFAEGSARISARSEKRIAYRRCAYDRLKAYGEGKEDAKPPRHSQR